MTQVSDPSPTVAGTPQGMGAPQGDPHFLYVLRHADDNLVMAQRLSEWVSWAPELEEDIALANFALDHLGQARALLAHAAELAGSGDEDTLAMQRTERGYTNLLLVEQPNGDFAHTMARSLFFDAYQVELWDRLSASGDRTLAGVAAKARKESRYHLRHSTTWVVRLGDGTEESHRRMQDAVDALWRYTGEMFETDGIDRTMADRGIGVASDGLRVVWEERMRTVLSDATLTVPTDGYVRSGGRSGFHTEHLGHLLTEMQWMQRTYPGARW